MDLVLWVCKLSIVMKLWVVFVGQGRYGRGSVSHRPGRSSASLQVGLQVPPSPTSTFPSQTFPPYLNLSVVAMLIKRHPHIKEIFIALPPLRKEKETEKD